MEKRKKKKKEEVREAEVDGKPVVGLLKKIK